MLVTLDEVKAQLNIDASDPSQDAELTAYADAAASAIEQYVHEVIEQREVVDDLQLCGRSTFRLWSSPVVELTSITSLDGATTYDVESFVAARSGVVSVRSGAGPSGWTRVTYQAGYSAEAMPERFKRAALIIIQHNNETQRGVGLQRGGVIGDEEGVYDPRLSYAIPRKALEWLGAAGPVVA